MSYKNMAKCRVCSSVIESQKVQEFETCNCGCIAISGGKERLVRHTRSWSDLEELSEYQLSWKDVLSCKQAYIQLHKAADNARLTGYSFFAFNDEIYRVPSLGAPIKIDKTVSDLPCTIKVSQ